MYQQLFKLRKKNKSTNLLLTIQGPLNLILSELDLL